MEEIRKLHIAKSTEEFDSDLAIERRRASTYVEGVELEREASAGGTWERLKITSEAGEKSIGRPLGIYDTLTVPPMDSIMPEDIEDAKDEIARELCRIFDSCGILPGRILIAGLGNRELTPDAVGTCSADEVEPTMHISKTDPPLFKSLCCSEICVIQPGVSSKTGISSARIIKSIAENIHPDVIIAIDSLASRSQERLGNTIQISNTGIFAGTGVGHSGCTIDKKLVGVPVIAIGVPTVISTASIAKTDRPREKMFVCPNGINRIVRNAGKIIGGGINQAFGICYF